MTKPALARSKRINRWNTTRVYEIEDRQYPSVTSVIGMMEKPALVPWAAKMAAEYAIEHHGPLGELPPLDAIDLIKRNWRGERDRAADFGTQVHNMVEEGIVPPASERSYPYVKAAQAYMEEHTDGVVAQELTIVNVNAGYAGTADLFAVQENALIVADWKTGNGLYESAAMQLVALANATHYATEDGELAPVSEHPYVGHAVRLHPQGYELKTVEIGGDNANRMYSAFVGLIDVWHMKTHDTYWD